MEHTEENHGALPHRQMFHFVTTYVSACSQLGGGKSNGLLCSLPEVTAAPAFAALGPAFADSFLAGAAADEAAPDDLPVALAAAFFMGAFAAAFAAAAFIAGALALPTFFASQGDSSNFAASPFSNAITPFSKANILSRSSNALCTVET